MARLQMRPLRVWGIGSVLLMLRTGAQARHAAKLWRYVSKRRKDMKRIMVILLLSTVLGCADNVDEIRINDGKQNKGYIQLSEEKKTEFWADIDVTYIGEAHLMYQIYIFDDEKLIYSCESDALNVNVKMYSTTLTINDKKSVKYQGKLDCIFNPKRVGEFKIDIKQIFEGNFTQKEMHDLLIKQ